MLLNCGLHGVVLAVHMNCEAYASGQLDSLKAIYFVMAFFAEQD